MMPLSHTIIQTLGWTLAHFLWQGAAVAAVLILTRRVASNATVRYAISIVALTACVLLPIATFVVAQSRVSLTPTVGFEPVAVAPSADGYRDGASARRAGGTGPIPARNMVRLTTFDGDLATSALPALERHAPAIVLAWAVGVALMTARLLRGCWLTRRLKRVGVSSLPPEWSARVEQLARQIGLRRGVRVMTSTLGAVPMAVGVLRPVVLVPVATLLGLTQQQFEAILIHELVHVRRWDGLVVLLERIAETVLFYHPAVWWITACSRTEREHCTDDAVAARTDAHLYAGALATVEQLRAPALAAAASDGSLLARVRRLVAPAAASGSTRITVPNVIATLGLMLVTAAAIGVTTQATAEDTMDGDHLPGVVLDVRVPTQQDLPDLQDDPQSWSGTNADGNWPFSSIVDAYVAALRAGGNEWSASRVAAVFGYPFHFALLAGAPRHDHNCNIETWQIFDRLSDFGWETTGASHFTGAGNEPDVEALAAARERAWEIVTASIDRGMPAIAWSPNAERDFAGWGLLVGYDADRKIYYVSHVRSDSIYTIPFNGFGRAWLSVIAFTGRTEPDPRAAEIATLRRAIEFGKGLRYTVEDSKNCCEVDAIGLDAYQLWLDALAKGEFDPAAARSHAWQLYHTRRLAAEYARDVAERFDGAASAALLRAADHYAQESEVSRQLLEVVTPWANRSWTPAQVEEARRLLDLARRWDWGAIVYLEIALHHLGEPIPGEPLNAGLATLHNEPPVKIDVDMTPTVPHRGTTLGASLEPVFHALGDTGWTPARIQGVLGHLFHFQMAEDGGTVYHDNLDWSLALTVLEEIADYRTHEATKESSPDDRAEAIHAARDAVITSLSRGIPAMAWDPRTPEQKETDHPGGHGVCWGLLVGYDDTRETYSIRHPFVWEGDYSARYDEIGENHGHHWFNVVVFDSVKRADDPAMHRMALANALSFADGERLGEHKWLQGFKAYEQWLEVFESDDELPDITHHHANILRWRRELAVEYLRDVAEILPAAKEPLENAAAHYAREHEVAERLWEVIEAGRSRGYSDEERAEATQLLRRAYAEDRAAIDEIRAAVAMLDAE